MHVPVPYHPGCPGGLAFGCADSVEVPRLGMGCLRLTAMPLTGKPHPGIALPLQALISFTHHCQSDGKIRMKLDPRVIEKHSMRVMC